jgi:hypothetical protein
MGRLRIAGIAAVLALAGCGEESGVTEGTVPFKTGNVEQLAPMKNRMNETVKSKAYMTKPPAEGKPAAESRPAGESKPAPSGKPEEKKP